GRARTVDVARLEGDALSLLFVDEGGASRSVSVTRTGAGGELAVSIDGTVVPAVLNTGRGPWGRRAGHADGAGISGPQRLVAPMPGKVVRVLVAPGDTVKARQPLVVVEAMKMENELRSPKDGVVRDVKVGEGMSVEAGSLLAVVE
ncbi:MAG TPA: biotin/lipoyl-containing protein, partial [Candidatus Saccharimonadales bacterium]|nr:biotin/lipoyl-containing protein [Candidatus Saccharimonadales bacterium]